MAAKPRPALDPVADLGRRLAGSAATTTLRTLVVRWWDEQGLAEHPPAVGKRIARALLEQPREGSKQAGVIVLQELLADHLRTTDLPVFEKLFAADALTDGNVVDWFAVKVLGTMLLRVRGRAEVARALASWRNAESIWQRRAACVAFT